MISRASRRLSPRYDNFEPLIEYLDFKRFTDVTCEGPLIEDIAEKCRVRPPRLIITLDNAAFDFALKYRGRLGAEIPMPDDWVALILDVTRDSADHYNYSDDAFTAALATRSRVPIFLTARPPGDFDWSQHL